MQRRTEASRSAAAADRERGSGDEDYEPRRGDEQDDDDDSGDAKETRLTLMEEVLLLGLKDREVVVVLALFFLGVVCSYVSSSPTTIACFIVNMRAL